MSNYNPVLLKAWQANIDLQPVYNHYKAVSYMPEDSKDIYKSGINEKYINRPTTGKFSILRNLCLAEFSAIYHKKISCDDNDFQSNNLPDRIDTNDSKLMELPKLIKSSDSVYTLSRRNRGIVLKYYKPNKEIHPEKHAHFLLILFYPFTDEKQLVINGSNVSKLNEKNVLEIINQNKQIFQQNLVSLKLYTSKKIYVPK